MKRATDDDDAHDNDPEFERQTLLVAPTTSTSISSLWTPSTSSTTPPWTSLLSLFQRPRPRASPPLLLFCIGLTVALVIWTSFSSSSSTRSPSSRDSVSRSDRSVDAALNGPSPPLAAELGVPDWVYRANVSHLFDWTWKKQNNNGYDRYVRKIRSNGNDKAISSLPLPHLDASSAPLNVVNDVRLYLHSNSTEGVIVDDAPRLPNLVPHPLPRARDWKRTCSELHIDQRWATCAQPGAELDHWLPSTTRFVAAVFFDAFVDNGSCHPAVPGTVFNANSTFIFQRWTNNACHNSPIVLPQKATHVHIELIDSLGQYLEAVGHFGPQQLPRLLRLLAVSPVTAKVLVANGGVADKLMDILVDRNIVDRARLVPYEPYSVHYAKAVFRSEPWPYIDEPCDISHTAYDRSDMQLVHRTMVDDLPVEERNLFIVIERDHGEERSIIEHEQMVMLIRDQIKTSGAKFSVRSFRPTGHIRDHIALFSRARAVIGPHGAGMFNVYWLAPGTHVVEIGYSTGMTFPEMYAEMALHLDLIYHVCIGRGDYNAPIHVDLDDLQYTISNILAEIAVSDSLV